MVSIEGTDTEGAAHFQGQNAHVKSLGTSSKTVGESNSQFQVERNWGGRCKQLSPRLTRLTREAPSKNTKQKPNQKTQKIQKRNKYTNRDI